MKKVFKAWAAVDNTGKIHLWLEGRYAIYSATHGKDVSLQRSKQPNNFKLVPCEIVLLPNETKRCWMCKLTKPVSMFSKGEKARSDGLSKTCKDCDTVRNREWRRKNPVKASLKSRRHVEKYPYKNKARIALREAVKRGVII